MNGITGKIKFDENGLRTDISLEVVDLVADGVNKVCIFLKYFTSTIIIWQFSLRMEIGLRMLLIVLKFDGI